MAIDRVAVAWFRRRDYDWFLKNANRDRLMESSFDQWEKLAERAIQTLGLQGISFDKVVIDPKEFAAWLRANNVQPDQQARVRYAVEIAQRKHGGK